MTDQPPQPPTVRIHGRELPVPVRCPYFHESESGGWFFLLSDDGGPGPDFLAVAEAGEYWLPIIAATAAAWFQSEASRLDQQYMRGIATDQPMDYPTFDRARAEAKNAIREWQTLFNELEAEDGKA